MAFPLLSTKLFIPQVRKALVRRLRLLKLLESSRQYKLILVSAPAGYGKTTLVSSWLKERGDPCAWISLDEGDNDFNRFFIYMFEALRQKVTHLGDSILQILQTMPPSPESFIGLALNELSSLAHDIYLVIDDYHIIDNQAIHTAFNQIILNSPSELHFIVCSRTELPFSVSRLRSNGEMLEITLNELRLSLDEIDVYMNKIMGAGLRPDDISILQDRTEGWLVGLQMTALSLQGASDPGSIIRSIKGDNRFISDYLIDEVLLRNPENLREFLLQSSILERMEASLCNYVLQIDNSLETLESIDKRRLFIIPLDDYRHWFRYHHLFREMLRDRLLHRAPEKLKELYQRAADWHYLNGFKDEAIGYSFAGGNYSHAMTILGDIGLERVKTGQWNQVLEWFALVPKEFFLAHPKLWVVYFAALINQGSISTAEKKLQEIYAHGFSGFTLSKEEMNRVKGEMATCRGVVMLHSQIEPSEAKTILSEALSLLSGDTTFRWSFARFNYGVSCLEMGDIEEAQKAFEEAVRLAKKIDFPLSRLIGSGYLAETYAMAGNYQAANELYQDSITFAHQSGLQEGAVFSKTNLGLGSLLYEWNQFEDALRYTQEGIRLAEQGGYLNQLLFGYTTLMRIQYLQGDATGVQTTIQRARNMCQKYGNPPLAVVYVDALKVDAAQLTGNTVLMDSWVDSRKNNLPSETNIFSHYVKLTHAHVLLARGKFEEIRDVIRPIWDTSLRQGRTRDAISCEVILAKSLFMKGEPLPAIKILERALYKAESSHLVRVFLDEGGVIISMIKQILASRSEKKPLPEDCSSQYLYFLLGEVAKNTLMVSTDQPLSKTVEGLEPLTEHELQILKLIEAGFPNKHIAQEMNISLNTVKYHLKNIYGKLGVVNRTQAARIIRKEE